MLSIIIPTLNSEATIKLCLDSIISQIYTDYEVLIIDAVSNDKTSEIFESYNDARIKFFSEPDEGIYDAMNKGIKLAKGDWIYFMGSDDKLYNEETLLSVSKYLDDDKLDIIYGNVIFMKSGKMYDKRFSPLKLLERNICHQSIFVRSRVFDVLGLFETEYRGLADWHFNMKWFNDKRIKHFYLDNIIAYYYEDGYCFNNPDNKFYQDWNYNVEKYYPWNLRLVYKLKNKKIIRKVLRKIGDE